jgi:hypothetical protein
MSVLLSGDQIIPTEINTDLPPLTGLVLEVVRILESDNMLTKEDRRILEDGLHSCDISRNKEVVKTATKFELLTNSDSCFRERQFQSTIHHQNGVRQSRAEMNRESESDVMKFQSGNHNSVLASSSHELTPFDRSSTSLSERSVNISLETTGKTKTGTSQSSEDTADMENVPQNVHSEGQYTYACPHTPHTTVVGKAIEPQINNTEQPSAIAVSRRLQFGEQFVDGVLVTEDPKPVSWTRSMAVSMGCVFAQIVAVNVLCFVTATTRLGNVPS